jgi:hypothetical protein
LLATTRGLVESEPKNVTVAVCQRPSLHLSSATAAFEFLYPKDSGELSIQTLLYDDWKTELVMEKCDMCVPTYELIEIDEDGTETPYNGTAIFMDENLDIQIDTSAGFAINAAIKGSFDNETDPLCFDFNPPVKLTASIEVCGTEVLELVDTTPIEEELFMGIDDPIEVTEEDLLAYFKVDRENCPIARISIVLNEKGDPLSVNNAKQYEWSGENE